MPWTAHTDPDGTQRLVYTSDLALRLLAGFMSVIIVISGVFGAGMLLVKGALPSVTALVVLLISHALLGFAFASAVLGEKHIFVRHRRLHTQWGWRGAAWLKRHYALRDYDGVFVWRGKGCAIGLQGEGFASLMGCPGLAQERFVLDWLCRATGLPLLTTARGRIRS